jgi:hypothetical protein
MLSVGDQRELTELVLTWVEARPFGRPLVADAEVIPQLVQALITTVEPYRRQVLADARRFLAFPKPIGLGLAATLVEQPTPLAFAGWSRSIRPLHARLRWSETMSGDYTDSAHETIARVVWEDGRWLVAQLWDVALRDQAAASLVLARRILQTR